jgi:DNA primase
MYDTKKAISGKTQSVTKEDILSKIDEYALLCKYLGDFKLGGIMNSPVRKDKNPSFCVYYSKKLDKLFFTDYGTKESGDAFKLLQLMFNMTLPETLKKIWNELDNKQTNQKITKTYDKAYHSASTIIGVVRQPFTDVDLKYWGNYGISQKTLKKFNVSSIRYYLQNNIVKGIYRDDCPMYCYKIFDKFKIYRPLGNKYIKWRCNTTADDIQGYQQLPKTAGILIITKSLKDVMVLHEMGLPSITPSSESTKIPKEAVEALKKRFKTILVLYDRDFTGIRYSRKILKEHGFKPMLINKKYKTKDVSDYVAQYGINSGKELIYQMINKTLKCDYRQEQKLKTRRQPKSTV